MDAGPIEGPSPQHLAARTLLHTTLKPHGVLFSSNPRGNNEQGMQGERFGAYHDLATWRTYLAAAGFTEIEHYYRPPGLPRDAVEAQVHAAINALQHPDRPLPKVIA